MQFISFQATAATGAPKAHACPRSQIQPRALTDQAGLDLPCPCPVLFLAACLGLPHYPSMPPLPDTPATPSTAGIPHHLALIPVHLQLLQQKHLPAVFQIIDPDSHLCKKRSCFDKERAVLECLPERPHHSWSFSGVSVTIQLGGPVHLLSGD